MPLFVNTTTKRPNRLEDKKDLSYHLNYGRWTLQSMNHPNYRRFITNTMINWSFFKGGDGQWIFDEDLEAFFLDESGDVRNRLKIAKNLIKPMVQQYIGNAVRLTLECEAKSVSDFVINRREQELARVKFFEKAAEVFPESSNVIRDNIPLGDTPADTEEIFENLFVQEYERPINNLIQFYSEEMNIDEIKVNTARNIALSGMGVYKGFEQNGRYLGTYLDPMFFFWDMSALKPDLSDAEYMGEWYYMDVPTLLERFQDITNEQRKAIERYSQNESINIHRMMNQFYSTAGSKIPVYETYWKDVEKQEYGWVKDPYGYPYFAKINHPDSKYTDKDLINPPTDEHKNLLGGKKKAKVYVDVLRYCIFIPKEEIGSADTTEDIVLEYGEVPYQEKYTIDPSNVQFPYKVYCWSYDKGEVLSPLDDAIQPQRFINRLLSVAESQINNSRGSGTVIDKNAVDPRDTEAGIIRDINKSKPIFVDTSRVGSVQNAVGTYGSTINQGTMAMFDVINAMQQAMQDMTGINESMTGTMGGKDALVGVIEAQIQRGSLVQEPFYYALSRIVNQAYQHMATVGKAIAIEDPRRLAIMTGDKGMEVITLTKDHALDDFRVFVKRTQSKESRIEAGNQLLFTLVQAGLLDSNRFANLYNRATPEMVADALREYHKELLLAQKKKDQMDVAAEEQMAAQQQSMLEYQVAQKEKDDAMAMAKQESSQQAEMERTLVKEAAKNEREDMKWAAKSSGA